MKTTGNTILITGGSAGIGFEIAKLFSEKGNKVIITGRDPERMENALDKLDNVEGVVGDVSNQQDVEELFRKVSERYTNLNMLVNNAGKATVHDVVHGINGYELAKSEMEVNYLSIIRMNQLFLPLLEDQPEAAIINMSSIVGLIPARLTTYSASKAALHAYTLFLRFALERRESPVKVFEVLPPLVNTAFSASIGGEKGIPPSQVADELFEALEGDFFEIPIGDAKKLYGLHLVSPEKALEVMNQNL